jgi:hypothetical protein
MNRFVRVDLTYNYPEDSYEDDDGERVWNFNDGDFGGVVISLDDPSVFVVVDNSQNDYVEYYADGIASVLRENHGSGPYTLEDVESNDVNRELSELYQNDCSTMEAFISMKVSYTDLTGRGKWISVSDKLAEVAIWGIHPFAILSAMKKREIF